MKQLVIMVLAFVLSADSGALARGADAALATRPIGPAPAIAPARAVGPLAIGMNLAPIDYFSSEVPFIDRMLTAGAWTATNWGAPIKAIAPLGPTGLPRSLPEGANIIAGAVGLDPPEAGTTRRYVILFEGKASFTGPGMDVVSRKKGRIVFASVNQVQTIAISDLDPADPLRDLHIVREDQLALFQQGEMFNPAFLAASSHWAVLRFMDWSKTNGNPLAHWSERTPPDHSTFATITPMSSTPIEIIVALANKVHRDPWINVPAHADDDYVRRTLGYVRDHLDPALKLHLEYSNEMWNGSFEQTRWAVEQAKATWNATDQGNEIWYGYRAAQIAAIARPMLGDRLRMVIGVFTAWWGIEDKVFAGIAKVGDAKALFDEYAITTYFGDGLSGGSDADKAVVLGWARGGAAGVDAAFRAIEQGGGLKNGIALASLPATYAYHKKVADRHGLTLVAYEGGFGATAFTYGADQPLVVDFLHRIAMDPRMGADYTRMAKEFHAAGGGLLNVFADVGPVTIWGTWGTADTIYSNSPRLEALKAMAQPAR